MKILAVDTALGACSVALIDDNCIADSSEENRASKQAEYLLPMIESLLENNKITYSDIDLLACTIGPGSFTGVRIGMTAIKGIAMVTNIPVIGVSTLESIARNAYDKDSDMEILSVINAMRGQFYIQRFSADLQGISQAELIDIAEINHWVKPDDIIAGNAIDLVKSEIDITDVKYIDSVVHAGDVGLVSALRYTQSGASNQLLPLYIRKPDAKLPKQG